MSRQLKVMLACVGLFVLGGVTGGFVVLRQQQQQQTTAVAGPKEEKRGPTTADSFGPNQMLRFAAGLDLTEEQKVAIRPILMEAGEELRRMRRESFRAAGQVIERMEAGVAEQLTEEQQVKLAEMQEAQREAMRQRVTERERRRSESGESGKDGPRRPGPGSGHP